MSMIDKEQQAKNVLCFLANRYGCTFENSFVKEDTNDFCANVYTLPMYDETHDKMNPMMLCSKNDVVLWKINVWKPKIVVFRPSYADYLEKCLLAARKDGIIAARCIIAAKYYVFAKTFDKLFMCKDTTLEQILIDMDMSKPVA